MIDTMKNPDTLSLYTQKAPYDLGDIKNVDMHKSAYI